MPYVDVDNGVRLYVQDVGDGPPVVLVAGFGLDHQAWDRQVRVLAGRYRVICVDQRGHGRSDKPLGGYEVERLALDLKYALDRTGVRECALVGWSFGGQVAFKAAADDPERIRSLVLVGSNAVRASRGPEFPFGVPPEKLEPALVADERDNRIRARRATLASGFASPPDDDTLRWLLGRSLRMPSWAAVACYRSMLYTDLTPDLPRVAVPVLQVIGSADPVYSAKGARWLNQRLPDARLAEIDGCGHYPMIEAPEEFDAVLLRFLAETGATATPAAGISSEGTNG
jgi:pimeloyl-ACP methyl ester carboxylesterase